MNKWKGSEGEWKERRQRRQVLECKINKLTIYIYIYIKYVRYIYILYINKLTIYIYLYNQGMELDHTQDPLGVVFRWYKDPGPIKT